MNAKQIAGAVLNMVVRLSISCIVVLIVYRLAMYSYNLGFVVFADVACEREPGRDITVSVEIGDSVMDIGKTLEKRGLIKDAKVFFVQEYLSEFHGKLQPGVYTLNTSMKSVDMMGVMAASMDEDEKDSKKEESQSNINKSSKNSESDETNLTDSDTDAVGDPNYEVNSDSDSIDDTNKDTDE